MSGIIYVKTSPDKCYERIKKRNRQGENIPLEYLLKCSDYHDDWIENHDNVLVFDGDIDFKEDTQILNKWIETIKNFIKNNKHIKDLTTLYNKSKTVPMWGVLH